MALAKVIEARDPFSKHHSERVCRLAKHLAQVLKLDEILVEKIGNASLLHDIGMICVPDNILLKPGSFTDEERKVIEHAPVVASQILEPLQSLKEERLMILHIGERWDGSGYPEGLKEEEIPVGSRIIAVAEAIDAMLKNRAYRRAQPISFCLAQLESNAGSQFDPRVAQAAADTLSSGMSQLQNKDNTE